MFTRRIGPFHVAPIGMGCMNFNHAYGTPPPPEQAQRLLLQRAGCWRDAVRHRCAVRLWRQRDAGRPRAQTAPQPHRAVQQGRHGRRAPGRWQPAACHRRPPEPPSGATAKPACSACRPTTSTCTTCTAGTSRCPSKTRSAHWHDLQRRRQDARTGLVRSLGRHAAARARGARHRRGAERVFAVDAQPGDRVLARPAREDRHRLRRLQPAGARLLHGHAARSWRCWRRRTCAAACRASSRPPTAPT
jgi:hypothetical protein